MNKEVSRRVLLAQFTAGTLLLSGCVEADSSIRLEPQPAIPENELVPGMGDIVNVGRDWFLLRNNKAYQIPNVDRYKGNTKFEKYGRRMFTLPQNEVQKYENGMVPKEPYIIDPFSGTLKENKRMGGEMNIYFGGFTTDGGDMWDLLKPEKDMFFALREHLKRGRWDPISDSIFFTYGEKSQDKGYAQYEARHTMVDPRINIKHALEFFQTLKEKFPLCQFNLIGHSLGAVFALEIAKWHSDAVNNVVLINGPVKGIEVTTEKKLAIPVLKAQSFLRYGSSEQVTDYLIELWRDEERKRAVEEFAKKFKRLGRKLTVVIDENDLIVPPESAIIENAALFRIPRAQEKKGVIIDFNKLREIGVAHGRPLSLNGVMEKISEQVGEDLADAA